jgi:osmoprotectant transport system ATP-binding protein
MIIFRNAGKNYGSKIALKAVDMEVRQGELLVLIGPSGCGKTTSLKLINGLIMPTEGEVMVEGKSTADWNPIELKRRIGYVIQQVGLFPYMKIWENIAYVLKIMGVSQREQRKRAEELINLVEMDANYLDQYPRQLSGGQQQRIGVARALAAEPDIILMDEPFGAIDQITRTILQDELMKLQKKLKKTIIFVTHDIQEAMRLGNRIALFNEGGIEQIGSARDLIMNPASDFVGKFFGNHDFMSLMEHVWVKAVMETDYTVCQDDGPVFPDGKEGWDYDIMPITDQNGRYMGNLRLSDKRTFKTDAVTEETSVRDALKKMLTEQLEWIAVIDDSGVLVGTVAFKDLHHKLYQQSGGAGHSN